MFIESGRAVFNFTITRGQKCQILINFVNNFGFFDLDKICRPKWKPDC